jgi:hypothetical protein
MSHDNVCCHATGSESGDVRVHATTLLQTSGDTHHPLSTQRLPLAHPKRRTCSAKSQAPGTSRHMPPHAQQLLLIACPCTIPKSTCSTPHNLAATPLGPCAPALFCAARCDDPNTGNSHIQQLLPGNHRAPLKSPGDQQKSTTASRGRPTQHFRPAANTTARPVGQAP